MPGANTSQLQALLSAFLMKKVLEKHQAKALYDKFAQPDTLPKNSGDTAKWWRYENLDEVIAPVAEGVTPPPLTPRRTEVTCTVDEYIFWMPFTDRLKDIDFDSRVIQNLQKKLSQMAVLSIDTVKGNTFTAGSNVVYANGVAGTSSVEDIPSADDFILIQKTLKQNLAEHVTERIMGSTRIATTPIREAYIMIAHTDLEPHFDKVAGFVHASKYPQNDAMPNEYGILTTQHAIVGINEGAATAAANGLESGNGTNANVYKCIAFGTDAMGTVGLAGQNMQVIFKDIDSGGAENPGNQRGSIAIKTWDGEVILDDDYLVRYECAAEVAPSA
jgi:N4-gp56 family major capsid protein